MRPSVSFATLLVAAAVACGRTDAPTAPGMSASVQLVPTANSPCTVHWAAGVNGSWFDATKWNPQGVPGAGASVCIDAAGTYAVTMDPANDAVPVGILALTIGGSGATATLSLNGLVTILNVQEGINIAAGSNLELRNTTGATVTVGGIMTNAGTLAGIAGCGGCGTQNVINADLLNQGTLNAAAVLTLGKVNGAYENTGTIHITTGKIEIPATAGHPTFAQDGGLVMATNANFGTLTMYAGTYTANGGELRVRSAVNPRPIIILDGANLVLGTLASPAVIGVTGGATTATTITGDIPATTTLWLAAPMSPGGTIAFVGNPVNSGIIHPVQTLTNLSGTLTLSGSGRLTNAGSILQSKSSGSGATFHYQIDVTNNGTISATDGTHINFNKAGGDYRNNGSITFGTASGTMQVRVIGSTLTNGATATLEGGAVLVDGGRLVGTGPVNSALRAMNGGIVEPGLSPGIMPVRYFQPTATGVLRIELGGIAPGSEYDQLHASISAGGISPVAQLAGTLDLVEVNGFQSGLCGQVFDVVVHSMASGYGTFATINGLAPGAGRAMRVVYQHAIAGNPGSGRVRLVGYDATAAVCIGPNPVALSEGAAGVQYAVLLNHAPTSNVTVTPQANSQVTVGPPQLVFTPSNWQQPQFFTVTAVDDAAAEGPHTGSVTHSVSSTDASFAGFVPASLTTNIADNDVNSPPVAGNDQAQTAEDTPVTASVLTNDSDPEGQALTITASGPASHGSTLIVNAGTQIQYTPAPDYNGPDSFSYTISDGNGTATAVVNVTVTSVNDLPVAGNNQATVRSGNLVEVFVLANDSDPDGGALAVTQTGSAAHGTVSITGAGQTVSYRSVAGYIGNDQFTYTVSDGSGGTATATVSVTVVDPIANTPPVAVNDAVQMKKSNGNVRVSVLDNDVDAEGDRLTLVSAFGATNGTVALSGRTVVFTITNPQTGQGSFTYQVRDALGAIDNATVVVTWPPLLPSVDYRVYNFRIITGFTPISADPDNHIMGIAWNYTTDIGIPMLTTVDLVIELPEGTVALGMPNVPPGSNFHWWDMVPHPGCTIEYGNGVPVRYRCTNTNTGGANPFQYGGSFALFVRRGNPKTISASIELIPALPDPHLSNNRAKHTTQKP